ncbi:MULTISPECIES: hypothetical protein [Sphingobacterium]|uniref:hypothetical protein n=1 Tax=Sphingobacterium TaxID=28453 RepID=UPI0013DCC78B|nr:MULTISPECIES: hypothetical protein [unclassified Sphingobacterium]
MKKLLVLFVAVAALHGCSKGSDSEPENNIDKGLILGEISTDRPIIGTNQIVKLKTTKPKNSGETTQYKWVVTSPDGKRTEVVNHNDNLEYFTSDKVGTYNVELFAESLGKEGASKFKFESRKNDFIQAIFGNSSEVIESSCLEVGKQKINALVGYYWPFDKDRPATDIKFDEGRFREVYLFNDNKFIGGTKEIYAIPFDTKSDGKGGIISNSYINYLSIAIDMGKEVFGNEGKTELIWKVDMPQFEKDRYLNGANDYNSALGWAMHEGALGGVVTTWESSDKIGKSQLVRNSTNNFNIKFIVVKK